MEDCIPSYKISVEIKQCGISLTDQMASVRSLSVPPCTDGERADNLGPSDESD